MVYCPYCGVENEDGAKFCQECGHRLPPLEEKDVTKKLINWKAILFGGVVWLIFYIFALIIYVLIFGVENTYTDPENNIFGYAVFVMQLSSGLVAGYISANYRGGVVNALIVALFYSIVVYALILGLSMDEVLIVTLMLGIFGIIGGILGALIKKKTNFNLF